MTLSRTNLNLAPNNLAEWARLPAPPGSKGVDNTQAAARLVFEEFLVRRACGGASRVRHRGAGEVMHLDPQAVRSLRQDQGDHCRPGEQSGPLPPRRAFLAILRELRCFHRLDSVGYQFGDEQDRRIGRVLVERWISDRKPLRRPVPGLTDRGRDRRDLDPAAAHCLRFWPVDGRSRAKRVHDGHRRHSIRCHCLLWVTLHVYRHRWPNTLRLAVVNRSSPLDWEKRPQIGFRAIAPRLSL